MNTSATVKTLKLHITLLGTSKGVPVHMVRLARPDGFVLDAKTIDGFNPAKDFMGPRGLIQTGVCASGPGMVTLLVEEAPDSEEIGIV